MIALVFGGLPGKQTCNILAGMNSIHHGKLLGLNDPPPLQLNDRRVPTHCLVVADHAGNAVPAALQDLGLARAQLSRHIALDIGARQTAALLAARLRVPALLANYSRLVVDLNRRLDDPSAFITESDGIVIPGNQGLDAAAKQRRVDALYRPYHDTLSALIDASLAQGQAPAIISVHSFTPCFAGQRRPWHVGILWDQDDRIARPLLARLRRHRELMVGDNEPYSGKHPADYTIDHHAEARGLANVSIEVRQDLISDAASAKRWAQLLATALAGLIDTPASHGG